MKTITATILVLVLHSIAFAGAIEDGAVRPEDYDLLSKVVRQLNGHQVLGSFAKERAGHTFTTYLTGIRFLGRVLTPDGYRNIFITSYYYSAPYESLSHEPAKASYYFLCVKDGGEIEFFGRTDLEPSRMDNGVLKLDNVLDLKSEKGWRFFKEVRPIN